jgi:hypothetical protein
VADHYLDALRYATGGLTTVPLKECPTCGKTDFVRLVRIDRLKGLEGDLTIYVYECQKPSVPYPVAGIAHWVCNTQFCTRIATRMEEIEDMIKEIRDRVEAFELT